MSDEKNFVVVTIYNNEYKSDSDVEFHATREEAEKDYEREKRMGYEAYIAQVLS